MEHLFSSMRQIALLPGPERIERLRQNYWVGYARAEAAIHELENVFLCPKRLRMPNLLVIGPTNNGKTMIVEKFRRQHLPYMSKGGGHEVMPVLMVQMPGDASVKRFYATILQALGAPVINSPSVVTYETLTLKILEVAQVKMLIIDELHNMLAGNTQKQREFLNVLRYLGNLLQISLTGVGTKEAYLAIRTDDQLENRFEPIILPLWKDDEEFMKLLSSFERILPLQKSSDLLNVDVRHIILANSGGTIGEICKLLTCAACKAIESGKEYIDQELLEQVNYRSPMERRRQSESILAQS